MEALSFGGGGRITMSRDAIQDVGIGGMNGDPTHHKYPVLGSASTSQLRAHYQQPIVLRIEVL